MYENIEPAAPGTTELDPANSRKRALDQPENDVSVGLDGSPAAKRPTSYGSAFPLLKLLIPNFAAGALIGRNGQNIAQLQATYGAKIRLSSSSEFYPGTHERIAIITGTVPQLIEMQKYVMEKVRINPTERETAEQSEKPYDVKIIIPNATAGLVIGKGGSNIKNLTEVTGAKIIITAKSQDGVPGERIITVSGSLASVQAACAQIIPLIAVDPENMTNRNLSYDNVNANLMHHASYLDPHATGLGAVGGLASRHAQKQAHATLQARASMQAQTNAVKAMSGYSYPVVSGAETDSYGQSNHAISAAALSDYGEAGASAEFKTKVSIEMHVPDIYVGAVLGKGGKTATELMQYSGARIQFSNKGDYAQGTSDRILTIQCDNMTAAQVAHFLVCQKIDQAKVDYQYQSASRAAYT